jgi:hypothetical protein
LRDVDLDAAIDGSVADEDDLAFDADAAFGETLEVGEAAVVGVDDRGSDVAGSGPVVIGGEDARVALELIDGRVGGGVGAGVDVFAVRAGEDLVAYRVEGFDKDGQRLVEQDAVGNDLGLQARGFEAGGYVLGGGVVLG